MEAPDLRGMPVLVAARLSQKRGDGQTGLETQDIGFRQWAEAQGATIIHVAGDHKSGTSAPWDRPNLRPWVTDPKLMRLYKAVGGFKLDRISRGDDEATTRIEDWARENDKWLITAEGLYYPCEGVDGIRWDLMKRIAHQEWLGYSEKYRRMHEYLRENKYVPYGAIPYGYRTVKVAGTEHKVLELDPVTAPFVRDAVNRYLDGDSIRTICAWLDTIGVKPRRAERWDFRSLQKIFHNPVLMGRWVDGKGKLILKVPPIISNTIWHALQEEMKLRSTYSKPAQRGAAPYSGLVFCLNCGRRMAFHISQGTRRSGAKFRTDYYRCHGNSNSAASTCRNMIRADFLDVAVNTHMTDTTPGAHGAQKVKEIATIPGHGYRDEIAEIGLAIHDLDMDDDDYLTKAAQLHAERARLKALPVVPDRIMERVTGLLVADYWTTLDAADRRAFLIASKARIVASKDAAVVETQDWVMAGAPAPALA